MTTRKPAPVAILAARMAKAYPSLSAYSAATLAEELCALERAQRRHAERCCSGADGGYVRRKTPAELGYVKNAGTDPSFYVVHDPAAEERAGKRIVAMVTGMMRKFPAVEPALRIDLQGDPRGPVLLAHFPGEAEASGV